MKRIYCDRDYCVNCRLCEVACITAHSKSKNTLKAYKKEKPRPIARVIVEERLPVSMAVQCRHCDNAACVRACISGAMTKDLESGITSVDSEKCVGCWTCVAACPYGAVRPGVVGHRKVAVKCDLCADLGEPACLAVCPNEALTFEGRD